MGYQPTYLISPNLIPEGMKLGCEMRGCVGEAETKLTRSFEREKVGRGFGFYI